MNLDPSEKEHEMKMNAFTKICLLVIFLLWGLIAVMAGCATFTQPQLPPTSGFLKDYSKLRSGKGDEALMVYINRGVNFDVYDSVLIDPVSIIYSKDSNMAKLSATDRQGMADYFYAVLEDTLSKNYIIASKPGSLTMRLRFALTDIKESQEVTDTVSSAHPIKSAIDTMSSAAVGSYTFLGAATAEMEILDSMNNQRLAAAVDRRTGALNGVKDVCEYWAQRVAQRLYEFSRGYNLLNNE
jgi:hypothetical protein